MRMGLAMMMASVVPMRFWPYAIMHAVYVYHRLPTTTAAGYCSPFQAKYGIVPNVARLKKWGCVCYVDIPVEMRTKGFTEKAMKGYFLGIHEPTQSYYVYCIATEKIVKSIHVVFDEVTVLQRPETPVLEILPTRHVMGDFEYLVGQVFRDDENQLLYVTTRIAKGPKNFIVAYVAEISLGGVVHQEEQRPLHVPEVAKMVLEYQKSNEPMIKYDLGVYQLTRELSEDVVGAEVVTEITSPTTRVDEVGVTENDVNPNQQETVESRGGTDHPTTSEPRHRVRKRRVPLNVSILGDTTRAGEHAKMMRVDTDMEYDLITDPVESSGSDIVDVEYESDADYFHESRRKEIWSQLIEKQCWIIEEPKPTVQVIPCRWVDVLKDPNDSTSKKSRLVARGDRDARKDEYTEVYAPVARMTSLRILLALIAIFNMYTLQMDVNTAFLNAELTEEIYMKPPSDLMMILLSLLRTSGEYTQEQHDILEEAAYRLRRGGKLLLLKSLYGLVQAPKNWFMLVDLFLRHLGFVATKSDPCLYYLLEGGAIVLLLLYVDDILLASTGIGLVEKYYELFRSEFDVKLRPDLNNYLKVELHHDRANQLITMSLSKYIRETCERFNIVEGRPVTTPMLSNHYLKTGAMTTETQEERQYVRDFPLKELLGCLNYIAITCRPDIAYAVSYLAGFQADPTKLVCQAVHRLMRYLLQTHDMKLQLGGSIPSLVAMCDSDFAGDVVTHKSTSGHLVYLGGGPVVWYSKKQKVITHSTAEAEFVALTPTCQNILGIRLLLLEIPYDDFHQCTATTVFVDNAAAIQWASNPIASMKAKHLAIRYKYPPELVRDKIIRCVHILSSHNASDVLTKSVSTAIFQYLLPFVMGKGKLPKPEGPNLYTDMNSPYLEMEMERYW